jgi:diguanylate cyclase (GGDEF)-like protein/PAS domain S-box-containing protein
MLGYVADDVVNQLTPADVFDSEELAARAMALSVELGTPIMSDFEALTAKASRGIEDIYELTYVRKDGSRFPAVVSVTALRDAEQAIVGYLLTSTDNTARKQAEEERRTIEDTLFAERELARVALGAIGDAVISTDVAGKVAYLNPQAETLTGWSRADGIGRPLPEVLNIVNVTTRAKTDGPSPIAMRLLKTVGLGMTCALIRRDGSELLVKDSAAPIHDRDGRVTGAVIVVRDVSETWAFSQRMAHSSEHDPLTDLPNRALLDDRIGQALAIAERRGRRVALLFVDLDRFKQVNDSLGHAIGDALLQSVAGRLRACLRATDTISRWGGDEFVVLLSQLDAAETAAVTAAKVIAALSASHVIGDHVLHISASIGIGIWPDDARGVDELITAADAAMYKAKERGGNTYQFFTSELNDWATDRHTVEKGLRRALQRQELTLHLPTEKQPSYVKDDRRRGPGPLEAFDARSIGS